MKALVVLSLLVLMLSASAATQSVAQDSTAEYRIGPNDVVQVDVLRLPEVSRESHVTFGMGVAYSATRVYP